MSSRPHVFRLDDSFNLARWLSQPRSKSPTTPAEDYSATMNQDQLNQLHGMMQILDSKVEALKDDIGARFNALESRVSQLERNTAAHSGSSVVHAPSHASSSVLAPVGRNTNPTQQHGFQNPQQATRGLPAPYSTPASRAPGSSENAGYLPFAIEAIAKKYQNRHPGDGRKCTYCHSETFSLSCFRLDHYRWCRRHQRPILPPHNNCGRDYQGCQHVKWEVHPDWEQIVSMSYAASLGSKGVHNLDEKLFPRADFPNKYDWHGKFAG